MREREVPQEGNRTLAGHRKAVYAVAENGKLRLVPSRGWEVEEIVTRQAVEAVTVEWLVVHFIFEHFGVLGRDLVITVLCV